VQSLPVRSWALRRAAHRLLREENLASAHVDVLLTGDEAVQELNRRYRGLDKPTDVLSFAQRDAVAGTPPVPQAPGIPVLLGDVVISVDTAARQAGDHGVSLEQELALLTIHGILHLLGHEDESESGASAMHARERELLGFTFPSAALPG
jgi:probable rRNA maturation factor